MYDPRLSFDHTRIDRYGPFDFPDGIPFIRVSEDAELRFLALCDFLKGMLTDNKRDITSFAAVRSAREEKILEAVA